MADQLAVQASQGIPELIPLYFKEYFSVIKDKIDYETNAIWRNSNQKFTQIKQKLEYWPNPRIPRHHEVVLNRLRAGHSRVTHGYLMENNAPRIPPICPYCQDATLTVKHLFISCTQLERQRSTLLESPEETPHLAEILGPCANTPKIIDFLKNIQILDEI